MFLLLSVSLPEEAQSDENSRRRQCHREVRKLPGPRESFLGSPWLLIHSPLIYQWDAPANPLPSAVRSGATRRKCVRDLAIRRAHCIIIDHGVFATTLDISAKTFTDVAWLGKLGKRRGESFLLGSSFLLSFFRLLLCGTVRDQ